MKDLEIRGAGNLLGGEQSGHIADVGFDLYIRLVGEAVAEFKGETPAAVEGETVGQGRAAGRRAPAARLRARGAAAARGLPPDRRGQHRRTSSQAVRDELLDRYGPLPAPVETLLEVASLRVLATDGRAHARSPLAGKNVRFAPVELPESRAAAAAAALPGQPRQARRPYDPGAAADAVTAPDRRRAAPRRRAPGLVP